MIGKDEEGIKILVVNLKDISNYKSIIKSKNMSSM